MLMSTAGKTHNWCKVREKENLVTPAGKEKMMLCTEKQQVKVKPNAGNERVKKIQINNH